MTARSLLDDLTGRRVRLWAESGKLKFEAPRGTLTDEDKGLLIQNKTELINLLTRPPIGYINRPMPVRGRTMPIECLWDNCNGSLVGKRDLYQCDTCRLWFKHLPEEIDRAFCPKCSCMLRNTWGQNWRHSYCKTPGHYECCSPTNFSQPIPFLQLDRPEQNEQTA